MATTESHEPPAFYPSLAYRDAAAALEWLERVFGFERVLVAPGPNGTIAHAEMAFGNGIIMFGTLLDEDRNVYPADAPKPRIFAPYVYVADVQQHYEHTVAAGATIVQELTAQDYGGATYLVEDCEGNMWSFGSYLPERTPSEASLRAAGQ